MKSYTSHPPGIFLVAATEMWERFSYYGISALFVLYLTAPVAQDGFGWAAADAVRLYGLYAGLAFAAPAVGGWISSGYLGERRCIAWGGAAIMLGHVLLGGPAYFPALVGALSGVPVEEILRNANVAQGGFVASEQARAALVQAAGGSGPDAVGAVILAHQLKSSSFLVGLAFVVIGTALIKPTISSIVGKLYAPDDPRRVFGFTLFMAGIWSGAFAANFVAGTLGERLGWHYGFMAAALGMAIGLTAYLLLQARLLGDVGREPDRTSTGGASVLSMLAATTREERRRLAALVVMSLFTVVYSIAFYQKFGMLALFVKSSVDRTVGGFEVPASWFLSVSTVAFLLFAAPVGAWFARRARAGRPVDPPTSLTLGLGAIVCGYALLIYAIDRYFVDGVAQVPMPWFVASYAFFGIGDIFIWPSQLAIVTALAPRSMTSFAVGSWYVTVGAGTYIAGAVGAWGQQVGTLTTLVRVLIFVLIAIGVIHLLRPWFAARCRLVEEVASAPGGATPHAGSA